MTFVVLSVADMYRHSILYFVIPEDQFVVPRKSAASLIQDIIIRRSVHCSEWQAPLLPLLCCYKYSEIVSIACFRDAFLCEIIYVTKHVIVSVGVRT